MGTSVVVGHSECPICGEKCDVKQIQTKGYRLFYACKSPCNSCIRADGVKGQSRLWRETEFLSGVTVRKPSNVTDSEPADKVLPEEPEKQRVIGQVEEPESEPGASDDFDPDAVTEEPEAEPEKPVRKKGWIAVGVLGLASIAGAILS